MLRASIDLGTNTCLILLAEVETGQIKMVLGDDARIIRPRCFHEDRNKEVFGFITKLIVEKIHVPLKYRKGFDAILIGNKLLTKEFGLPRYQVELAYGRHFEPWIVSVKYIDDKSDCQKLNFVKSS